MVKTNEFSFILSTMQSQEFFSFLSKVTNLIDFGQIFSKRYKIII